MNRVSPRIMNFSIKKLFFSFITAVGGGFKFCVGLVFGQFVSPLARLIGAIDHIILQHILGPFYKLFWRGRKNVGTMVAGGEGWFNPFAHYFILISFVVLGLFFAWTNILKAQTAETILEQKPPIMSFGGETTGEEELISEMQVESADFTINQPERYLAEQPILDYTGLSTGISIDCDYCEEPVTAIEDTALLSPTMSLPSEAGGIQIRRTVEEYLVQKGDNLGSIAKKFGLKAETLLWANNLYSWSVLKVSQKLIIPPTDGVLYKIKKGDNLDGIAKQYKVDKTQILAFNDVDEGGILSVGKQIVIPGAKAPARAPSYSPAQTILIPAHIVGKAGFVWPASTKRITQYYSWRHPGIDIGAPKGSPIYAVLDGVVEYAGWGTGYGWEVVINHGNGMKTRYGHASKLLVEKGQTVYKGQQIMNCGSTGWSTGPHLHFELYYAGRRVNPLTYLR